MRLATLLFALSSVVGALSTCEDGSPALLDNVGVFNCSSTDSCPHGFRCQLKNSEQTKLGICCVDVEELEAVHANNSEAGTMWIDTKNDVDFDIEKLAAEVVTEDDVFGEIPLPTCSKRKFRLRCVGNETVAQAHLRWFFDESSASCEKYAATFCQGENATESNSLRTKSDCEKLCFKQQLPAADVEKNSNRSQQTTISPSQSTQSRNTISLSSTRNDIDVLLATATSDYTDISAEPFATPPLASSYKSQTTQVTTIAGMTLEEELALREEMIANFNVSDLFGPEQITARNNLTSETSTLPTVASTVEMVTEKNELVIEVKNEVQDELVAFTTTRTVTSSDSITNSSVSTTIATTPITTSEVATTVLSNTTRVEVSTTSSSTELPTTTEAIAQDVAVVKNEVKAEVVRSRQVANVLCARSEYRLLCENTGKPSQFVYRWQLIDGECHSFPYGYCFGGFNHAHPRTQAECEKFCQNNEIR